MIPGSNVLFKAQRGFRLEFNAELLKVSQRVRLLLVNAANPTTGKIPKKREGDLAGDAAEMIASVFTGSVNGKRAAFAADGVTALALFPRLLNKWMVYTTIGAVRAHQTWLKKNAPEDIYRWLSTVRSRQVQISELVTRMGGAVPTYDPMHTWVDPSGYRLSRRIWRTGEATRLRIDAMLSEGIRNGTPALQLARRLEQFLLPERRVLRTSRPYGTDASFDAMRLARTELSHAFNQAAYISAYTNPYVRGYDVARSAWGDADCPICPDHATIDIGGNRVRQPYAFGEGGVPPWHPHCLCHVRPAVVDDMNAISDQLRDWMNGGSDVEPIISPAWGNAFIIMLIGLILWQQFNAVFDQESAS